MSFRPVQILAVVFAVAGLLTGEAHAQITITESDVQSTVGERIAIQQVAAQNPSNFQAVFDRSGTGLTFDFTPYAYETTFTGVQEQWEASEAPAGVPFLDRFENRGANVVTATQLTAATPSATDSTFWSFQGVTSSSQEFFGFSAVFDQDIDGDGEAPDTLGAEWTPPRLTFPLPLSFGDTWSQNTEQTFFPVSLPTATRSGRESEVDAAGTLVTPAGSAPALRIRTEATDTTSTGFGEQISRTTTLQYITKDQRLAASVVRNDDTGQIAGASYIVIADAGESFPVAQGETPTLSGPGAEIQFQQPSTSGGAVDISRFDTPPFRNEFSGSAASDDGTSVTPNVLWEGRYFSIQARDLEGFAADVCVDTGPISGISEASKLVLLARGSANESWSPLDSALDGNQLCASVSSFSQFAVGSNTTFNSLPVELSGLTATTEGASAILEWGTASETNNAGFHVEHRAPQRATWADIGFVEGAGTTNRPQTYRFRVADLDPGTHRFRLRQVDTDGTAHVSDAVQIRVRMQSALRLTPPAPNPVQAEATLRFGVREAHDASVAVYDVLGRRVATLYDGTPPPGRMVPVRLAAQSLPPGPYFVRLTAGADTKVRRLTVVR